MISQTYNPELKFNPVLLFSDITTFIIGYFLSDPQDPILANVGCMLTILNISQDVQDELIKLAAGIILSVISRVVIAYSDNWVKSIKNKFSKRKTRNHGKQKTDIKS